MVTSHLKREDFQSKTWKRLTQTLQEELQRLRELNDAPSLSPDKTALVRGQIKVVKELLDLPNTDGSSGDAGERAPGSLDLSPGDWQN